MRVPACVLVRTCESGCIKIEEALVAALVPCPLGTAATTADTAAAATNNNAAGAEAGEGGERGEAGGSGGGEAPWVLVSEDGGSAELEREAKKKKGEAQDRDDEANAALQAALFRQIGQGGAGEGRNGGKGTGGENVASLSGGRSGVGEAEGDEGGLDPALKAAVERQKQERVSLLFPFICSLCCRWEGGREGGNVCDREMVKVVRACACANDASTHATVQQPWAMPHDTHARMHVQELIKQRIKDERQRGGATKSSGTSAPSNMIPVSAGDGAPGSGASGGSGVFLGGGGRSGGGRLTGLAIPRLEGEERGEEGGELGPRGAVGSAEVGDGCGDRGEENAGGHGADIAAGEGAGETQGLNARSTIAGSPTAEAKEGASGDGADVRDGRVRLLDDAALEARDAGVWFSPDETSKRVSSHVSATASSVVGAGRGGRVLSENELRAMGRWGEEVACKVLAERQDLCEVAWVNAQAESGLPYDITLRSKQDPQQVEGVRR